jgi:hypothetical protein
MFTYFKEFGLQGFIIDPIKHFNIGIAKSLNGYKNLYTLQKIAVTNHYRIYTSHSFDIKSAKSKVRDKITLKEVITKEIKRISVNANKNFNEFIKMSHNIKKVPIRAKLMNFSSYVGHVFFTPYEYYTFFRNIKCFLKLLVLTVCLYVYWPVDILIRVFCCNCCCSFRCEEEAFLEWYNEMEAEHPELMPENIEKQILSDLEHFCEYLRVVYKLNASAIVYDNMDIDGTEMVPTQYHRLVVRIHSDNDKILFLKYLVEGIELDDKTKRISSISYDFNTNTKSSVYTTNNNFIEIV